MGFLTVRKLSQTFETGVAEQIISPCPFHNDHFLSVTAQNHAVHYFEQVNTFNSL